ncbi:MAG TPA: dihydropteroate synthase [Solirubrobacteraceae bacterium]|nr:dihydropteroate synthase [Solirubrobacteraceae bacterium]
MCAQDAASPAAARLELGGAWHDTTRRALVMGILNRTRDSFFDGGSYLQLEALLGRADRLVADGADILDVGGRAGGVGTERVSVAEESERVGGAIEALRARFDVPLSIDTWRAPVAAVGLSAGATLVNDMSGFADPEMLPTAVRHRASVVATHIRLPPGVPDPEPRYDDVVDDVAGALDELVDRAVAAGVPGERIVVDPGLDLGKTWRQSLRLLGAIERFASGGRPVLVAASNKIFLGRALGLEPDERSIATAAACTLAAARGGGILRVHDARIGRQVADLVAAVADAASA